LERPKRNDIHLFDIGWGFTIDSNGSAIARTAWAVFLKEGERERERERERESYG
jgi:hypothetical protein